MPITWSNIILLIAALCIALMAGLFYNWTTAIIPGLQKLPDKEYLSAMQSFNRSIQNPLFFASFFGAAIFLPFASYQFYKIPVSTGFYLLLAAALLYWGGVMAVTIAGNIPLNNMLDKHSLANTSPEELSTLRRVFENKWNNLNTIRTVSSFISLLLVLLASISGNAFR